MRASICILPGSFFGGEIEPGTFHHFIPCRLRAPIDRQAGGEAVFDERVPARPTAEVSVKAAAGDAEPGGTQSRLSFH